MSIYHLHQTVTLCFGRGADPRGAPASVWIRIGPLNVATAPRRAIGRCGCTDPHVRVPGVRIRAYSRLVRNRAEGVAVRIHASNDTAWSCMVVTPVQPHDCMGWCAEQCIREQWPGGVGPGGASTCCIVA